MFQAWLAHTWLKLGSSLVIQSASWTISKYLPSSCRSLMRIHSALEISPRNPPSATVVKASIGGAPLSGSFRTKPRRSRSRFKSCSRNNAPASSASARRLSSGLWSLAAMGSVGALGRRQFTPVEQQDADQPNDPAQQEQYLAEGPAQLHPGDGASRAQGIDGRKLLHQVDHVEHRAEGRHRHE